MWCSLLFAFFVRKAHEKGKWLLPARLRGKMKTKRLRLLQSMQGSDDFENNPEVRHLFCVQLC